MRTLLEIALRRVWSRRWVTALCILLTTGAFGLLVTVVVLGSVSKNARREISRALSDPIGQYCEIDIDWWANDELEREDAEKIFSDIADLPAIKSFGVYGAYFWIPDDEQGESDALKIIQKEQRKHPLVFSEEDQNIPAEDMENALQIIDMTITMWPAFDFPLLAGETPANNSESLIYVGYNFRNCVKVGTSFSEWEEEYRIAGIFEKGATIPEETRLFWNNSMYSLGMSSVVLNTVTPLDNMVVVISPYQTPNELQFASLKEGYSFEDLETQIHEVTDPYHIPFFVSSFQNKLADDLLMNDMISVPFFEISLIIGISAVILILCTQMLSILQKKNDLGILLSQGISRKGLYGILFLENLIQIVPAAILSPLIMTTFIGGTDMDMMGDAIKRSFWKAVFGPIGVGLLLAVLIMTALSTALILLLLKSTSSATLLKGELNQSSIVVTGLFLLSFILSIGLIWYAATLKTRTNLVMRTQSATDYSSVDAKIYKAKLTRSEIDRLKNEVPNDTKMVLQTSVSVDRSAFANEINILFGDNELDYKLSSGVYPLKTGGAEKPSCVIGEGLLEKTYIEDEHRYIKLNGTPLEVTGILQSNHFAGFDYRFWVFGDSISDAFFEKCLNTSMRIRAFKNGEISEDEAEGFASDMEERFGESLESVEIWTEREENGYNGTEEIASLYLKVCYLLIAVSAISLVLFSMLWATRRQLRHMIMLVNGYSRLRVLMNDISIVFLYEMTASVMVLCAVFFIDLFKGNPTKLWRTFINGGGFAIALAIAFGLIALIPVSIRLLTEKPSIVLKHTE